MNDFLGVELTLGNIVIMNTPSYSGLCIGKVIAFTPQKVRIQYNNTWNYGKPGRISDKLLYPADVCKMDGPAATAYILRNPL